MTAGRMPPADFRHDKGTVRVSSLLIIAVAIVAILVLTAR